MTLKEKRVLLMNYCTSIPCDECLLNIKDKWSVECEDVNCPHFMRSPESDLDEALRLIKGKFNPYWDRITAIADRQRSKGLKEYGRGVEYDTANVDTRLDRIEEELIDALMYLEHLRDAIHNIREVIK